MSRPELIKKLKEKNPEISQFDLEKITDIFIKNLSKAIIEGKNVEIRGLGTFFTKKIKAKYSARNPKTGKLIYVPEKNKVRFKPSKKLKKFINE